MAYIESFILFWLLALIGGIILLAFIALIFGFLKIIAKLSKLKKKIFLETTTMKKTMKIFILLYILSMVFFYIERANNYLFSDRAHKEAKAYAIAGEYVFLWKAGLLKIIYPNNIIMKPLDSIESYILKKIYKYIPETDAEREIWNYKFHLINYARSMYAPMTKKSKKRGLSFTNPAASMQPKLLTILDDIYNSMDTLSKVSMRDKEFDKIDRHLLIASMAPYYIEYMPYLGNLNRERTHTYFLDKLDKVYRKKETRNKLFNYLVILDKTHQAMQEDVELAQEFEKYPRIKASYYWGATIGFSSLDSMQERLDDVYPCTNLNFLKWMSNYKEYVKWAYMTDTSSFKTLSKREKKNYDFKIENQNNAYYIAKYICKIPFKYITKREKHIANFNNFEHLYINKTNIIHIRSLEEKLNTGTDNE